ncbi:MAG: PqqD family protein, partial [Bacteroidales bacterium]|nr:PqqD family protein [Bacteroidales bacterium]
IMLLKKGKSLEEISEYISGKYDVDDLLLERDLEDFTSLLKDYGILE